MDKQLLANVANYYSEKLHSYGETPRGVDWNGSESQVRRFQELSRIFTSTSAFSVNDLGCGYGAYYDYLAERFRDISYLGLDVSESMIQAAGHRFAHISGVDFSCSNTPGRPADFGVASGIFNVKLDHSDEEWKAYLHATLDILNASSVKGFSFNCLTSYSDAEKMQRHLYYANPCEIFDHCKRHYSRNVALLHDYGLYEFTILVRKHE